MADQPDDLLVMLIQTGDPSAGEAMQTLLDRYSYGLAGLARRLAWTRSGDFEETLAEVKALFLEQLASVGFSLETSRQALDRAAKGSIHTRLVDTMEKPNVEVCSFNDEWMSVSDSAEEVYFAGLESLPDDLDVDLSALSPLLAEVIEFWLARPGLSVRECGRAFGDENKFKVYWQRAIKKLQSQLEAEVAS